MSIPRPKRMLDLGATVAGAGKHRRRPKMLWITVMAVVVVAAVLAWILMVPPSTAIAGLRRGDVMHGNLALVVAGHGKLVPANQVVVGTGSGGQVAQIDQRVGAELAAGEVILVLENAGLRQRLREAEKALVEERLRLMTTELDATARRDDLRNQHQTARDDLRVARLEVQGLQTLAEQQIITPIEYQKASIRAASLQRRFASLSSQLKRLDALHAETVAANATALSTLQDDVGRLRQEVQALTIRAPVAGRIVEMHSDLSVGTQLAAGATIAHVSAGSALAAEAAIPVSSVGKVLVGQPAVIHHAGKQIAAQVAHIDARVVRDEVAVTLSLISPPTTGLFPGQPVRAEIVTDQRREVTYVERPANARPNTKGQLYVIDPRSNELRNKNVHYGDADYRFIIIESGVEAGTQVVLGDPQARPRETIGWTAD